MNEEKTMVEENLSIGNNYFLMKVKTDNIASKAKPGNFIMVGVNSLTEPLLKRPFGIFSVKDNSLFLYYEVVGKGSKILSEKREGDYIDIVGPLGNGFPELKGKKILMIAGGRGIAPVYFGIEKYSVDNNVSLIYGAASKDDLNLIDRIDELNLKNKYFYTDDGSHAKKGFVTSDIRNIISENDTEITLSCGPEKMFESLNIALKNLKTENYVSMEAYMGCGIGVCHSCVVETVKDGYKKVCSDGPVFKLGDIKW